MKDPNSRLRRWALKLSEYDFEIEHRKGELNQAADALSRIRTIIRPIWSRDMVLQGQSIDPFCKQIAGEVKKGTNENFVHDLDGLLYQVHADGNKVVLPSRDGY